MTPHPPAICLTTAAIDGDTLTCDKKLSIRLCGIDAPERGQPFSQQATALLKQLTLNKNITVIPIARDKYGRLMAEIWYNNTLINTQLLQWGLAYAHNHNCPTPKNLFHNAQTSAQILKLNIWSSPQILPWLYRQQRP